MSKLDEALQDIIIDRDDGTPKYLACCFQDVEFGVIKHREGCSTVLARLELSALRARVEALEAALKKIAAMKKYKLNAGETIHEAYYKCYTVAESALKA